MRTLIQRRTRSSSAIKQLFSALTLGALSLSFAANAQPFGSDCTTTSIDVSTGIDNTGTLIPYPTSGATQDPYWTVTMVPSNTLGLAPSYCAELVDNTNATNPSTLGGHVQSGAHYISFATTPTVANYGSGCGMFNTYNHYAPGPIGGALPVRFTRQFYIEGASNQNVTIDMSGFGDDIIFIAVDQAAGTPIYSTPGSPNLVYYSASTSTTLVPMSATVTLNLAPGAHTLDVDLYDISAIITAVSLRGRISCTNQVLAKNDCYGRNGCGEITQHEPCENERCYWTVDGNNIYDGRNKFGTLTDNNINIVANGDYRGVITSGTPGVGNSFIGWNTMNPTSILHVDCIGNHEDGSGMSDIRFENLEHGSGNVLVIDDQGHVFRTDYTLGDIGGGSDGAVNKPADMTKEYQELKAQNEQLQKQLDMMNTRLNAMENCCANKGTYSDVNTTNNTGSALYQNTPNPFSNETTIEYYVNTMKANAFVVVYDLNGRELNRFSIAETGKGFVTLNSDNMVAGMYIYSLVIDGQEIDSKKLVLSKTN